MKKIGVAIIDDHGIVRMGLRFALSLFKDIEVVGEFGDGLGAAAFVRELKPDVTLLDICMPGRDGISALESILAAVPDAKVIMLTMSSRVEDIYRSLKLGAKGYVLKDRDPEQVVQAIRAVNAGETYVPEDLRAIYDARKAEPDLTAVESETLALLAEGLDNREIASRLDLSEIAIKVRLKHVYAKLGVSDRAAAIVVAMRRGLVKSDT